MTHSGSTCRYDIGLAEAVDLTLGLVEATGVERVRLEEAAGRVLAEDLASVVDRPERDDSALDGYAVRLADTASASDVSPAVLRLVGESRAGQPFGGTLGAAEAVRVATGALMPAGADAVIGIEHAGDDGVHVRVRAPADAAAVRRGGQDLRAGNVYLRGGTRLGAAAVALAAAMGHADPLVARRPRVLLVATGDELRPAGSELATGQLYDSNGPGLAALLSAAGAEVSVAGRAGDDLDSLARAADEALSNRGADLVISSGGVSRGGHDVVRDLLLTRGEPVFWRVLVRPAGPTLLARYAGVPWLGLPGNPVSSLVGCLLFALPFLQAATGDSAPYPLARTLPALVASRFAAGPKLTLHRARLSRSGAALMATTFENQSSGVLRSLTQAGALVVNPPHTVLDPKRGDVAEVLDLAHLGL